MEHNIILLFFSQVNPFFFSLHSHSVFSFLLILKYLIANNVFCYMKGGSQETFCEYEQAKRGIKEKWYFC